MAKFLANKMKVSETPSASVNPTTLSAQDQLENYLTEFQQMPQKMNWRYGSKRHASYSLLTELADDLVPAPVSQAEGVYFFALRMVQCRPYESSNLKLGSESDYEIKRTFMNIERCMKKTVRL